MTGFTIPHHGCFALIGNPDRGNRRACHAGPRHGLSGNTGLGRPDFLWIVLDPTWMRINLLELFLSRRNDISLVIKQHRPRTGSALIKRKDVLVLHICLLRFLTAYIAGIAAPVV